MAEPKIEQTLEQNIFQVIHDKDDFQFYIRCGEDKAFLEYKIIDESGAVDLFHTEVPSIFRGKGIAKILAKEALDYFVNEKVKFKLSCTYLQKYFNESKNADYEAGLIK